LAGGINDFKRKEDRAMPKATYGPYTVCTGEVSTGISVNAGDTLRITASGEVDFGSGWVIGIGAPIEGPGGPASGETAVAPYPGVGLVKNSLIFKIGSSFFQGGFDVTRVHSGPSGLLSLLPNDDRPQDNSRGWNVVVEHTTPNPPPPPSGTPKIKINAIEVVQAIQQVNNSIPLVAGHRTVVRAFVASEETIPVPKVTGRAEFTSIAPNGTQTSLFATPLTQSVTAQLVPNRDNQNDSLNFEVPLMLTHDILVIKVRAWVDTGTTPAWESVLGCGVDFEPRKRQELLPLLVNDTRTTAPTPVMPTMADFYTSMQGAVDRLPLADPSYSSPGFYLSSARIVNYSGDLTTRGGFDALLSDITHMIFFLQGNAGGTRAALVANDSRYAVNGEGTAGQFLNALSFVARAGLQATFAHELTHTFGFLHAPRCTSSSDGVENWLPGGIEDVGFHISQKTLIPRDRGELMSYSGDTARCPGPTRWPSIALWRKIYDHLK
jgi:hypothetical protein